jgi:hypothetical protein
LGRIASNFKLFHPPGSVRDMYIEILLHMITIVITTRSVGDFFSFLFFGVVIMVSFRVFSQLLIGS